MVIKPQKIRVVSSQTQLQRDGRCVSVPKELVTRPSPCLSGVLGHFSTLPQILFLGLCTLLVKATFPPSPFYLGIERCCLAPGSARSLVSKTLTAREGKNPVRTLLARNPPDWKHQELRKPGAKIRLDPGRGGGGG